MGYELTPPGAAAAGKIWEGAVHKLAVIAAAYIGTMGRK